jgi:predicted O-methyltransferase YrrM
VVERYASVDPGWAAVDRYVGERLLGDDPVLAAVLSANAQAGLPDIDVSPAQGKMLHLLARMMDARRILEIGTLGGYSTIWLARALPADGWLVTLEIDPHHAAVARSNIAQAGLAGLVEIRVGAAVQSLESMRTSGEAAFDLIFIDADKPSNPAYFEAAMALSRPGTAIIVDNVVREGAVADPASDDPRVTGTQALFAAVSARRDVSATVVQTVGVKKWDGFLLAIVDGAA